MMDRHLELVHAGKIEEANALGAKIPKGSMMQTHLKERFGLQYLIEEQYNLITPIKEYCYERQECGRHPRQFCPFFHIPGIDAESVPQ